MGRKSNYSESYKREVVAKAEPSGNVSQTAREMGISNKTLMADCGLSTTSVYRYLETKA